MSSDTVRQRRGFGNTAPESQQQPTQEQPDQQPSGGSKPTGTKRSLTIAIGGVLTLLGVASYTFLRQPSSAVDPVGVVATPEPTAVQLMTALESVATKRGEAKKKLEGLSRTERREEAKKLDVLTDLEVTAVLRAKEKSWEALGGALQVDTNQVSSNDPIEDYLASCDLRSSAGTAEGGGRLMVGVFDGHAGYRCAEQLAQRMGPMVDAALASIAEGTKAESPALSKAVVRLNRDAGHDWDQVPMALTAAFMAMDNELVHESLKQFRKLNDVEKMDELLGPAVAGSCGLVAVVDRAAGEVVVANTGDSRALLGVRLKNGTWKAVRLSEDHTAKNKAELARLARDHPGETVIRHGRVLGGLMPTRAFGDCRYKWPLDVQKALFPTLLSRGHRYATTPNDYASPPYVTAHPVIVRHRLGPQDKFIVVASDGLYDQMSDADIVNTVAGWYETRGVKGATEDANAATHLVRAALETDSLGRRSKGYIQQLLAIPPPLSRRFRDDISVAIVTLNDHADETAEKIKSE
ncbi:[Pyruvate dehydrogenase [acetyl-transferring]]-phosphatase 1, mitochondrial [Coemansia interrupta]|uniref:[Pyruvate dehydrogenase [acetyl-transferring]]-phosphatase 1, mitochondrial n=1 Tax=Coemansia interrupta TaxID=1126814 RepID=A0A9W8HM06_9FUNG|nr:[Pyruvate dehydrogenase [acetyl-transferring]]-phosphatase 1, mitochondrial [Coemansia interrupta]